MDNYPEVVCNDCAKAAGKVWPEGHIATFYPAVCGICGEKKTCTEPRDWDHFTKEELEKARKIMGV
jgi:hypothetical protein